MKFLNVFLLSIATGIVFIGCKKESTETLLPVYQPDAYFVDSVDGAFYAVKSASINRNALGTYDSVVTHTARAWFGNMYATKSTQYVGCNFDSLSIGALGGEPYNANWYLKNNLVPGFRYSDDILWVATPDSANKIPTISYHDSRSFPMLQNFMIPDSIQFSAGSSLTVKFKFANYNEGDQLLIKASGSLGKTGWATDVAATSEVLTATDLQRIAKPGDSVKVTILPIKIKVENFGEKRYAFIKETPLTKVCKLY